MPKSKSKSESTQESEANREPREPRALSNEYHKARKQLMLWAGILFIWELVGVDLDKAKEAGGNFGAIIGAIKSPQAVPWALLILVAYFLFKVTVEWHQCSFARRAMRASRIDFSSAWLVSSVAYLLYFGQAISRVQFADYFKDLSPGSIALGMFAGVGVLLGVLPIRDGFEYRDWFHWLYVLLGPMVLSAGYLISGLSQWHIQWKTVLLTMAIIIPTYGAFFYGGAIWRFLKLRLPRSRYSKG